MPRRPAEPPPIALGRPVTLSEASDLGLSRYELSTTRWQRLGRGVRVHSSLDVLDPMVRIESALAWLPSWAVLGGWASLRWQGVSALDGRTGPGGRTPLPLLVHVGPRRHLRPREGFDVDRGQLGAQDVVEVRGAQVAVGVKAVFDAMCRHGVEEGLVVGDAAWAAGVTTGPAVRSYVESHAGVRGVPRARVAAPLLERGVRSCPESRFRYVWVVEAGLARPLVNRGVVDEHGVLVGEADLFDLAAALAGEYDGSHHRGLAQHTADNVREEAFERLNVTVVRATSVDLWPGRSRLVGRVLDGHYRGSARDRSRDRFGIRLR